MRLTAAALAALSPLAAAQLQQLQHPPAENRQAGIAISCADLPGGDANAGLARPRVQASEDQPRGDEGPMILAIRVGSAPLEVLAKSVRTIMRAAPAAPSLTPHFLCVLLI